MWEVSDEEHKMNTIAERNKRTKTNDQEKKQQQQERKDNPKSQHVESRCQMAYWRGGREKGVNNLQASFEN